MPCQLKSKGEGGCSVLAKRKQKIGHRGAEWGIAFFHASHASRALSASSAQMRLRASGALRCPHFKLGNIDSARSYTETSKTLAPPPELWDGYCAIN